MVCWSIVACSQSRITGRSTFFLTRSLLGIIEGGFIPDVILYLSYFYKSKELPIRLSYFWGAYTLTSIVSAFLAFGILHLRGHNGMAGWQWLFALEGALTAVIGIVSWFVHALEGPSKHLVDLFRFYLPPSPTETKSRSRGKNGWFSEREEVNLDPKQWKCSAVKFSRSSWSIAFSVTIQVRVTCITGKPSLKEKAQGES